MEDFEKRLLSKLGDVVKAAQGEGVRDVDRELIAALGDSGAKCLGSLIGDLINKVGAERTDALLCASVAAVDRILGVLRG